MFKRISIMLGAVVVLAAGVVAWMPSATAHGSGDGEGSGWDYWRLPGVLEAEGEGIAAAAGALNLRLCTSEGILLTRGDAAVSEGSYDDVIEWLGLHVYFGFTGCAELHGKWVAALAVGHGLELRAEGVGIAFLKGDGTWGKDTGESGAWSEDGVVLKIGSKLWDKTKTPTPKPDEEEPVDEPHEPEKTPTPDEACAMSEDC
jgi:hypothetical protein